MSEEVDFSQIQTILGSSLDAPVWKELQSQLRFSQHASNSTLTFRSSYLWFDYSIAAKEFVACGIDAKNRKTNDSLNIVLPCSSALGESRRSVQAKLGKPQWTGSYKDVKSEEVEMLPFEIERAPNLIQDLYALEGVAIYMLSLIHI